MGKMRLRNTCKELYPGKKYCNLCYIVVLMILLASSWRMCEQCDPSPSVCSHVVMLDTRTVCLFYLLFSIYIMDFLWKCEPVAVRVSKTAGLKLSSVCVHTTGKRPAGWWLLTLWSSIYTHTHTHSLWLRVAMWKSFQVSNFSLLKHAFLLLSSFHLCLPPFFYCFFPFPPPLWPAFLFPLYLPVWCLHLI